MKNKIFKCLRCVLIVFLILVGLNSFAQENKLKGKLPKMYYGDTTRRGIPFAKDPQTVRFKDRYLMYYSIPGTKGPMMGWGIGIAESRDLVNWKKVADIPLEGDCEKNGIAAPSAIVIGDKVHLFYQTYGNWVNDAICHAYSEDGIHFTRNTTNPIFRPIKGKGEWQLMLKYLKLKINIYCFLQHAILPQKYNIMVSLQLLWTAILKVQIGQNCLMLQ
jgi:hypothetical protein